MRHFILSVVVVCLSLNYSTLIAAEFFGLGDLPGGRFESLAFRVSGDGTTVVGHSRSAESGERLEAFRWTRATGMVSLGDLPGGDHYGAGIGVSYNGSIIVGDSSSMHGEEAFRWTAATGMVGYGDLPGGLFSSQFQATSADGSVAVGDGLSELGLEATRWSAETGLVGLGDLPGGQYLSQAIDVSADGSVVVGQCYPGPMSEAFRWTKETGMVGLGDLPGGDEGGSNATAISANGRVIVGQGRSAIGGEAYRWTAEEGMVGLGTLGGVSSATAVSANGSVIVGQSSEAFIWTKAEGMRSLKAVLEGLCVNMMGWDPYAPRSISWDGRVITGWGWNRTMVRTEGWVAILRDPDPVPGDTDGDFDVDIVDLNNVRNHFGEGVILGPPVAGEAYPFNGVVDVGDLNLVRNFFGGVIPIPVSEPSTAALFVVAAAGGLIKRSWRRRRFGNRAIAAVMVAFLHGQSLGTQFTYSTIATRADGFAQFPGMSSAIADDGRVIFVGENPALQFFIGKGESLSAVPFPIGGGGSVYPAALNSKGQAAGNTPPASGQQVITRADGDNVVTIDLKPNGDLGPPDINELGQVSYGRRIDPGLTQIVVSDGTRTTVIANSTVVGSINLGSFPAMNNHGAVAFNAGGRILIGSGGETTLDDYIHITPSTQGGGVPSLNDHGVVAFRGSRSEGQYISYGDGGPLTELVNAAGPYAVFGDPAINNYGAIAFKAALDDGTEGIYTGLDPVIDRIIASGDLLSGSTVSALRFSRNGLNNRGEIAFWALMLDGQEGIFRATPIEESVPGDTDGDQVVDIADLNNVRNNFGGTGLGDTNNDGSVDIEDLNAVRNNFGAGSVNAVPEPPSLALLLAGTAVFALLRRRRAGHA